MPGWTERVFTCWKRLDLYKLEDDREIDNQKYSIENEKSTNKSGAVNIPKQSIISLVHETRGEQNGPIQIATITGTNLAVQKLCAFKRASQKKHLKLFMSSCQT